MTNCNDCGTALKHLFGRTWYCPNDCDKKPKATATTNECLRRWWTTISKAILGETRKDIFLVYDDPTKNRYPNLVPYEIKLEGEFIALEPKSPRDRGMVAIHPGNAGVIMQAVNKDIKHNP